MIINDEELSKKICIIERYYFNNISYINFKDTYKLFRTDDIRKDYNLFKKDGNIPQDTQGIVILLDNIDKFIVLIQYDCVVSTYLHELTHVFDFYQYKNTFKFESNLEIKKSKYYQILAVWSEYHAMMIQIVHNQYIGYKLRGIKNYQDKLKEELKSSIYEEIIDNFITDAKENDYHSIMWLFAGINVCNQIDNSNKYIIPDFIKNKIPVKYLYLFEENLLPQNFEEFLRKADFLHACIGEI